MLKGSDTNLDEVIGRVRAIVQDAESAPPSERALAESLGVARHQVRRALAQLRDEGELGPSRIGRRRIALPNASGDRLVGGTNPLEVIELRLLLEPSLARLAALRASAFEIARLAKYATTPAGADGGEVDLAFHLSIAQGSRNWLAGELYRLVRQVGFDARVRLPSRNPPCPKRLVQRDAEHRAIADALKDRNPDAAEAAMRAHLTAVQRRIAEHVGLQTSAA